MFATKVNKYILFTLTDQFCNFEKEKDKQLSLNFDFQKKSFTHYENEYFITENWLADECAKHETASPTQ